MKQTLNDEVRAFLKANPNRTRAEAHAALPGYTLKQVGAAIGRMKASGELNASDDWPARYAIAAGVTPRAYQWNKSPGDLREYHRKRSAERRRKAREAAGAEVQAAFAAKMALRAKRAQAASKRQAPHLAAMAQSAATRHQPVARQAVPIPAMTSEDFIREGGIVEVIPRGVMAQSLKYAGMRDMDVALVKWRDAA